MYAEIVPYLSNNPNCVGLYNQSTARLLKESTSTLNELS
jgi:hypothetical protein